MGGKQAWEQLCSKGILADGFTLHLNGVAPADLGQWCYPEILETELEKIRFKACFSMICLRIQHLNFSYRSSTEALNKWVYGRVYTVC